MSIKFPFAFSPDSQRLLPFRQQQNVQRLLVYDSYTTQELRIITFLKFITEFSTVTLLMHE